MQNRKNSWKHCAYLADQTKNELAEDDDERYQTFLPEEDEELSDNDFVAFMAKFEKNNKAQLAGMTEWEKKKASHMAWLNVNRLETLPDGGDINGSNKRQRIIKEHNYIMLMAHI